jgi:EmrB/QacA subfamily drug resistance transporter
MATEAPTPEQFTADPEALAGVRGWTLALACVAMFMLMLDVTVVNVALPDLRRSLHADFAGLQWVIDAYTLTLAAFLLTGGSLADRLGRKQVFQAGLVLFTLASLVAGTAQGIAMLNIARGAQGAGAAVLFSVGPALIAHEYRGAERGKAFGIFGAVAGLALACGPLIGGLVTDQLSWRWIFLLNVPVGLLALGAGQKWLRESRHPQEHPIDWLGMVSFGAGLALVVLGFLRGEASGWTSGPILASFLLGLALLVAFVVIERRLGPAAMFDLSLLRNRTFSGVCLATLLSNATSLSAVFLEISYVQNVLGYSPWETGLRFMPMMLTLFVVAGATGSLLNKVAPGVLIGLSIAFIAVGIGLVTLVEPGSSWTALLPSMFVTGIGMGLFNPPRAAVTVGVVEPHRAGMASGMGETFQQVGVAVGIAAFGAVFHAKVVHAFVSSQVGAQLGGRADDVAQSAAAGGVSGVSGVAQLPAGLANQLLQEARVSFVHGLTQVMGICAVFALVGAVIAAALIRREDLHESAQSEPT